MSARTEQFQNLVSRQPENELFRFSLAQALEADNRSGEALPHYEFCAAKKPDWMMPRILLGKILLSLGRTGEARVMLQDALDLAVAQQHETPEAELRAILAAMN